MALDVRRMRLDVRRTIRATVRTDQPLALTLTGLPELTLRPAARRR